ncbi:MAG: aminotransferase class V-fold PLP-dependent enzyme [Oculatellaceae cyanobacterium bins.114]|nr:aminotransferase class V-fold PLP-dependent enzyme [Oculatellaceae cyanobacterium bins.114]
MTSVTATPASTEEHRQHFPALANKAYFNYGGQGPLPLEAIAAIQQAHELMQRSGPFSSEANVWVGQEMGQVRSAIAAELHVPPTSITLTENVSMGCNIPLWGIDWRPGDHLLLSDCEHQSVFGIAQALQHRFGIELSVFPLLDTLNSGDPVAVITQHLRPTTRLVAISHVLWNTGQVLPLAEIVATCHAYPANAAPVRVFVDAAQSVGMLPLNLTESAVDFYAFTGHKWWCGPAGLGGLYVSPEAADSLNPTFVGWRSVVKDDKGYPTGWLTDGRRFEVATSDYPLGLALREAIALHNVWGTAEDRYRRICELSQYLWQRLVALDSIHCLATHPPQSGLVSFQVTTGTLNHNQCVQQLENEGFLLRTLPHPNCIRACVHYFTTETELDQLVTAIQALS